MMRLTDIIDMITDKIRKSEEIREEAEIQVIEAPTLDDLEGLEERVEELEEARLVFEEDHIKLGAVETTQNKMVEDIEEIKALENEVKEIKKEVSAKANMDDMEAALALKGDLELVNTKIGRLEFETAIEELGEAIGLLGIKFQRKNDEWEERAAEIWRGIDSKMTRDIFDEAVVKIHSRITALMYGLKKIKKVVEDLLYPDSSGVTRCITCRRPAGISGQLMKNVGDAITKRMKLEGPPFCVNRDTILR
ncbi:uncharacterized protein NPIL_207752 [Nephila pilipes]|uniref:DUF4795 domain-containing protein n=1 Tax=Nephila pilipes TaxID=299642 RepID=A0A8X6N3X4_NEPPI|nr:uncharacterized protein NPIL_207752 [Nephila pilipes]